MRSGWQDLGDTKTLRGLTGRLLAKVNWTGSLWRATTWTRKGSSSMTGLYLSEAMDWCEGELGK